jgi:PAS domain S-box-containing protein
MKPAPRKRTSRAAGKKTSRAGRRHAAGDARARLLETLVQSSQDAVIGLSITGRITDWGESAERIFGHAPREASRMALPDILPKEARPSANKAFEAAAGGTPVPLLTTEAEAKDGTRIPVSMLFRPVHAPGGRVEGVLLIASDLRRERARERELSRLARLYAALAEANQSVSRATEPGTVYDGVCRALVEEGGFRIAWVGCINRQTLQLVPAAVWGDSGGYVSAIRRLRKRDPGVRRRSARGKRSIGDRFPRTPPLCL